MFTVSFYRIDKQSEYIDFIDSCGFGEIIKIGSFYVAILGFEPKILEDATLEKYRKWHADNINKIKAV